MTSEEKTKARQKARYEANKEQILLERKLYREKNKNVIAEKRKTNIDKINKQRNIYRKEKLLNDPIYKLKENIRKSIINSIKRSGFKKLSHTEQILGCTYDEFKLYLESKFEDWMNWDNQGNPKDGVLEPNKTWDIDHIIPTSTAITELDIIKLNHHTNLQPLCSYYNRNVKRDIVGVVKPH